VVYEGELGIVIGRRTSGVLAARLHGIFSATPASTTSPRSRSSRRTRSFAQWTRAKSFDTFGVFGPWIETESIRQAHRENHPRRTRSARTIRFRTSSFPRKAVSLISQDMTLEAGDVIACGSSVGVAR